MRAVDGKLCSAGRVCRGLARSFAGAKATRSGTAGYEALVSLSRLQLRRAFEMR